MDKNICSSCGTENEPEYKYCKNCGSEIAAAQKEAETQFTGESDFDTRVPEYNFKRLPNGMITDSICSIPSDEIAFFVGKKAYDILPKFSKMELSGSKVSWCWPVAILGYLFGPIGAAFWFFYRKMYKHAVILSLIGAVITVTTVLTGGMEIDFNAVYNALLAGDMEAYMNALEGTVTQQDTIIALVSNLLSSASSILTCILCGLFGFYAYRNHCVNKINSYRAIQADKRYYKLGLASIGGVSGGMVVLGIVIMILSNNIASVISTIIGMLI